MGHPGQPQDCVLRWDQMWLNEGFAEYVSNIASHYIDPEIHTWERFYVEETQWVMYQDQDTRHHWAMTDPVTTRFYPFSTTIVHPTFPRGDIERKFGDFTYLKGGSVLRMVSEVFQFSIFHLLPRFSLRRLSLPVSPPTSLPLPTAPRRKTTFFSTLR